MSVMALKSRLGNKVQGLGNSNGVQPLQTNTSTPVHNKNLSNPDYSNVESGNSPAIEGLGNPVSGNGVLNGIGAGYITPVAEGQHMIGTKSKQGILESCGFKHYT